MFYVKRNWNIDKCEEISIQEAVYTCTSKSPCYIAALSWNTSETALKLTIAEADNIRCKAKYSQLSVIPNTPIEEVLQKVDEVIIDSLVTNALQIRAYMREEGFMCND